MAEKQFSHTEVWDDSILLQSWNDAYQEYLKYHSLAAKGEKVKIADPEAKSTQANGNPPETKTTKAKTGLNAAEIDLDADVEGEETVAGAASGAQAQAAGSVPAAPAAVGAMTQVLAANVQNEDMKNLMMSWYYAGYYTGLYEGKQQGYVQAREELGGG